MTAPEYGPFSTTRVENGVTAALNAIVSAAASFTPPVSLPSRRIAGAGPIPHDCDQVYATLLLLGTGTPEPAANSSSGISSWPPMANGANQTLYNATLTLAIVRCSADNPSGLGNTPPTPAAYLANLVAVSADSAVLLAALSLIGSADSSATPRTETVGPPMGGLIVTSIRAVVLI